MTTSSPARRVRTVVLDDDPTGTQASAGVPVLLDLDVDPTALLRDNEALFVLTNSRSLERADAVALLRRLRTKIAAAADTLGLTVEYVLRGDSTLRGHVFAESDVFGARHSVLLFVPAFPAGGRRTIGGVHYLDVDGRPRPVADTEFARDPVFGYTARTLTDWVAEVDGRTAASVELEAVRADPSALPARLAAAPPGSVLIPDARTDDDLVAIDRALDDARAAGVRVVLRCAATLAALRARRLAGGLLAAPISRDPGPTLVVCGSHTEASTAQLHVLADEYDVPIHVLDTGACLDDPAAEGLRVAVRARHEMRGRGLAIIATERVRRPEHDRLADGAAVMTAVCQAVSRVARHFTAVIAKGGITSADVARRALGARTATVVGPLLPGVPVWRLPTSGTAGLPYAVVPGNVGGADTLVRAARAFDVS